MAKYGGGCYDNGTKCAKYPTGLRHCTIPLKYATYLALIGHLAANAYPPYPLMSMLPPLEQVVAIAVAAGEQILAIDDRAHAVTYKTDGSPLTAADQHAHAYIERALADLATGYPILSEESAAAVVADFTDGGQRPSRFWLVDPLDGTQEFLTGSGEFTVNIALIDDGWPVLGVVHEPVARRSYFAAPTVGAFVTDVSSRQPLRVRAVAHDHATMMTSRRHTGAATAQYQHNLQRYFSTVEVVARGSSLKICRIAAGQADIYPRLWPTAAWDTAAAHCILAMAGGQLTDVTGRALYYHLPTALNPWFLASGDPAIDWTQFAGPITMKDAAVNRYEAV